MHKLIFVYQDFQLPKKYYKKCSGIELINSPATIAKQILVSLLSFATITESDCIFGLAFLKHFYGSDKLFSVNVFSKFSTF